LSSNRPHLNPKASVSPYLVLFIGILAVSTASILIRYAHKEVQSLSVAAWRIVLASLLIAPMALKRQSGEIRNLSRKEWFWLALSSAFLALHFASWITSLEYTTVAVSVVLVSTSPIWVALFSALVLHERLHKSLVVGLVCSIIGGTTVGLAQMCEIGRSGLVCSDLSIFISGKHFLGNFLALVGAWSAAGYLMIGRKLRPTVSLPSYTFLVYGMAGVILVFMAIGFKQRLWGFSPQSYLFLLGLAVFPQMIGHSSLNWSLKYMSTTFVSVALLGEPIGSTILAYLFLQEVPSLLVILGGILILVGIFLASVGQTKERTQAEDHG